MSARAPHCPTPQATKPRIVESYSPERDVAACIRMKLPVQLHNPDLGRTVELEIISTREQLKEVRKSAPLGNETYFCHKSPEWWTERKRLCDGLKAATTRTEWADAMLAYDKHHGRNGTEYRDRKTAGREYDRADENAVTIRRVVCYSLSDCVTETCLAHGLRCERISLPAWDFVVVKVWATHKAFKAAQYEWLQQMIATQPRPEPVTELDLFA